MGKKFISQIAFLAAMLFAQAISAQSTQPVRYLYDGWDVSQRWLIRMAALLFTVTMRLATYCPLRALPCQPTMASPS